MKVIKALILFPISFIYAFIVNIRNTLFDLKILKSYEFDLPVISVGNITVGGTGKTPTVEYLVSLLKPIYKVAVLSRGYKRKTKGFFEATKNSTVDQIGDEPLQIKLKFPDILVVVCESRVKGIQKLIAMNLGIQVVILDDAFQHRYVKPGVSILLYDYTQPFLEDKFLPYGRLREHPYQRHRADIILVTKTPDELKPIDMRILATNLTLRRYQNLFYSKINYNGLMPVYQNELFSLDPDSIREKKFSVVLVTGIGNPKPLEKYCENISTDIHPIQFGDHHQYTGKDLQKIIDKFNAVSNKNKIIVTTEKDAVRFRLLELDDVQIKKSFFYYAIEMVILNNEKKDFNDRILTYVKRSGDQYKFIVTKKQY
jgi:tetraacyldisaccharide 4'-kinase